MDANINKIQPTAKMDLQKLIKDIPVRDLIPKTQGTDVFVRKAKKHLQTDLAKKIERNFKKISVFFKTPKAQKPLSALNQSWNAYIKANITAQTGIHPDIMKTLPDSIKITTDYLTCAFFKAKKCIPKIR